MCFSFISGSGRRLVCGVLILTAVLMFAVPALAQDNGAVQITSPASGESLLGFVLITGTASHPQFARYRLEFSSEDVANAEWFSLTEDVTQQVRNGTLAQWDTTKVPDGRYQIRLRVVLRDGNILQTAVTGLTVRNQVPTALPTQLEPATPAPPTPLPTEGPSPTPLIQQPPTNTPRSPTATPSTVAAQPVATAEPPPFVVAFDAVRGAFCNGALCAGVGFVLFIAYAFFQTRIRPQVRRALNRHEDE